MSPTIVPIHSGPRYRRSRPHPTAVTGDRVAQSSLAPAIPELGSTLLTWDFTVGLARIELATSALSVLRSNQLSYSPGNRCTTLHQGPGTAADGTHAAGAQAPTGRWTSPPRPTPRPPAPPRPPRPPRPDS